MNDNEQAAEIDAILGNAELVEWARGAFLSLPKDARKWDRFKGGHWRCVFRLPTDMQTLPFTKLVRFMDDEFMVVAFGFAAETEADLAGWAWARWLHGYFNLLAFERDPLGAETPAYLRAEWFPEERPGAIINFP